MDQQDTQSLSEAARLVLTRCALDVSLAEAARLSAELQAEREENEARLGRLDGELIRSRDDYAAACREIDRLNARLVSVEQQLMSVTASRSWRVTAPLRRMIGLFRKSVG